MAVAMKFAQSPCVIWKPELPRVDRKCESHIFNLDGCNMQLKLTGCWNEDERCEAWELSLKKSSVQQLKLISLTGFPIKKKEFKLSQKKMNPPAKSILVHFENKFRELKLAHCCEICFDSEGYNSIFEFNRVSHLQSYGITQDKISMVIVFDLDSKCSQEVIHNGFLRNSEEIQGKLSNQLHLQSLSEDVETLFNNPENSNAVLKCCDRSFHVNKEILAARSKVIAEMLKNDESGNETVELNITDIQPAVLDLFLKYICSGRVENMDIGMAFELYKLGEKYAVPLLKRKCSAFMVANLSTSNLCSVLLMADMFRDVELLNAATAFAGSKHKFFGSLTWQSFAEENPAIAVKVFLKFHE